MRLLCTGASLVKESTYYKCLKYSSCSSYLLYALSVSNAQIRVGEFLRQLFMLFFIFFLFLGHSGSLSRNIHIYFT